MRRLYLDLAATSPIHPKAFAEYVRASAEYIGNPSSPHSEGHKARRAIEEAREKIAQLMGCGHAQQIIFTSGGTESNNIAMEILQPRDEEYDEIEKVITTPLEHHSAQRNIRDRTETKICDNGVVDEAEYWDRLKSRSKLHIPCHSSIQFANADIGTIQDIRELSETFKDLSDGYFFTDAVQAVGHIPINMQELENVDFLSASAHKFGGVKGVGFLYVAEYDIGFPKLMYGGKQEVGMRAGTENVPAIIAMAKALECSLENLDEKIAREREVQKRLIEGLSLIPDAELNGVDPLEDPEHRLPNNVSFSFKGIFGDTLVALLDAEYNIQISAGAACETGSMNGNRIVRALGKSDELAKGTIRITFPEDITDEEVDYVLKAITDGVKKLRNTRR